MKKHRIGVWVGVYLPVLRVSWPFADTGPPAVPGLSVLLSPYLCLKQLHTWTHTRTHTHRWVNECLRHSERIVCSLNILNIKHIYKYSQAWFILCDIFPFLAIEIFMLNLSVVLNVVSIFSKWFRSLWAIKSFLHSCVELKNSEII